MTLKTEETASLTPRTLRVSGHESRLCVNNEVVQLLSYPDNELREKDSDTITSDGQIMGESSAAIVEWIGPPRFCAKGSLIALYLGSDPFIIAQLDSYFGPTLSPDMDSYRNPGLQSCL